MLADDPTAISDYELRCPAPVVEDDVYTIEVTKSGQGATARIEPIEGYWSTHQISADMTDYPHMQPTHQIANDFESLVDQMRRNFRM